VSEPYELVVAAPAARAIADELPEAVANAVIDLITGPLLQDPRRIGRELRRELHGVFAARRGTYRVLYRIDDARREVTVIRIDHRRDVYRS
jgi:mRNA-degrading endonuclease RelE of RelBE toxin-antitoxin system